MTGGKIDLKRDASFYGGRAGAWARVSIPPARYLAREGAGAPESPEYAAALAALYPVAYGVKFACKGAGLDFVVPPLSAQWWSERRDAFVAGRREEWQWRAMIRMPDFVTAEMVAAACAAKGQEVALVEIAEGDCFQTLHLGPYSEEGPMLAELHDRVMPGAGVTFGLPHHEIYLSDPRRVAPEKLRTILRQPVVPV